MNIRIPLPIQIVIDDVGWWNGEDPLFPPEAQDDAARQIKAGFEWAGVPNHFKNFNPPKPHCYDEEIQETAFEWFDSFLKT